MTSHLLLDLGAYTGIVAAIWYLTRFACRIVVPATYLHQLVCTVKAELAPFVGPALVIRYLCREIVNGPGTDWMMALFYGSALLWWWWDWRRDDDNRWGKRRRRLRTKAASLLTAAAPALQGR